MGGDVYKRRYPRVNPQEVGVPRWRLVSKKAGNFAAKTFAHVPPWSYGRRSRKENKEEKTTRQRRRQLNKFPAVIKDIITVNLEDADLRFKFSSHSSTPTYTASAVFTRD